MGLYVVTQELSEQTVCQPGPRYDDIAAAVTLGSISRKAYLYLQKKVGLPLPDKLFEILKEVDDSGFKVVAIVSDMGGRNLSLWQNLQISTKFLLRIQWT
ncbi:hypothetical protein PR048_029954 [Dryococelus australis]|uniref:Uncharacterized protein n=1 Tax=Dryococelus australis TaxID=614101 RepID=A0ABQ9GAH9_9NEOP|nr:hypothetical protein PR048_029954 [Dryococelus australis]